MFSWILPWLCSPHRMLQCRPRPDTHRHPPTSTAVLLVPQTPLLPSQTFTTAAPASLRQASGCKALLQLGPFTLQRGKLRLREADLSAGSVWGIGMGTAGGLGVGVRTSCVTLGSCLASLGLYPCKLGVTVGPALWGH